MPDAEKSMSLSIDILRLIQSKKVAQNDAVTALVMTAFSLGIACMGRKDFIEYIDLMMKGVEDMPASLAENDT